MRTNMWKYIDGEPKSFQNEGGNVPTCTDAISAACTNQENINIKFGWDKFAGEWNNTSDPKSAYFLRVQTWDKQDDIDDISKMILDIGEGINTSEVNKPGETIVFDDKGNFYNENKEFLNPMFPNTKPETLPEGIYDRPVKYITKFNLIGTNTSGAATGIKRWFIKNSNIIFNSKLTYFIRAIYKDGKKTGYGLYYNPIHRDSFKTAYINALNDGNLETEEFESVIRNYCDATTDELSPRSNLRDSRWGDPTCGCSKRINIQGNDYGFSNDKNVTFYRYFNDGFGNNYSVKPAWPYSEINDEKDLENLSTFVSTNNDNWGAKSACYSPACKYFDGRNEINSYLPGFVTAARHINDVTVCTDADNTVNILNCDIGFDGAGNTNVENTNIICSGGGGGQGDDTCPPGTYNDALMSSNTNDKIEVKCQVCPKDTYSAGISVISKCMECPAGTTTNGLTGQITCSKDMSIYFKITGIILGIILGIMILLLLIYLFKDEIFGKNEVVITPERTKI